MPMPDAMEYECADEMDLIRGMYANALRTRDYKEVAEFMASDRRIEPDEHIEALRDAGFHEMAIALIRVKAATCLRQRAEGLRARANEYAIELTEADIVKEAPANA